MGPPPRKNPFRQTLDQRKHKFDPEKVLRSAKEESATPWSTFKNEIIRNNELVKNVTKTDLNEKRQADKVRMQNHSKFLIEEKRKEQPKWDDFKSDPNNEIEKFKKNKRQKIKTIQQQYADKELDVKHLTPGQNNFLRSKITRAIIRQKGSSFKSLVHTMKRYNSAGLHKNF